VLRELREYDRLDRAFDRALAPWRAPGSPLSLLFSGGVDSGLLAWELRSRPGLRLVTVGVRGSADLRNAESAASALSLAWAPVEIPPEEIATTVAWAGPDVEDLGRVPRGVLVSLAIALRHAPTPQVICGQGADELFLGYAHFRGLSTSEATTRAASDLRQLIERDWPRSERIAARAGRTLVAPYLDAEFVAAAEAVPLAARLPLPEPKHWFREWARHRGLPKEIADRPKRAFQFGSGFDRWLRRPPA
jgi:asparagine synthase (glutamine-hydrolysing)